jgi:hypothetical protein
MILAGSSAALAWHFDGYVRCDGNKNGELDGQDIGLANVGVHVENLAGTFSVTAITDSEGYFTTGLQNFDDSYVATIDMSTVPADAVVLLPAGGQSNFSTDAANDSFRQDWLIQSATCQPGECWMTGGGTKLDSVTGTYLAEKGTKQTFGGNVHPGCSATAGAGGDWNHVDRANKLHFHGTDIPTVSCGNIPNFPPGSTSPKTPFNYIEYSGTGWVKGLQGNKADYPLVYFFARVEDRNEPGSNGAKAGSLVDRYYLRVWAPDGTTLILIDDVSGEAVDPALISSGNLQIHVSSCDNPPLQ